jgi:3-oxoacyl-[acyl-carrier-protein] synthase-3
MHGCTILSTGSYLPDTVITNNDLSQFPASARNIIAEKTGVLARRHALREQSTSDLAAAAARVCLEKADFAASRVQAILVSTSSPDRMQPATATRVQHLLGAERAFAFDMNSVCSGSVFGIALAHAMIRSGSCENVLFVAAELYSRILNRKDFSTFPFFGDGAGAILFGAGDPADGVLHSCLRTDGSGSDKVCVPGGGTMLPLYENTNPSAALFRMDGRAVFDFAVSRGHEVIREVIEEAGVSLDEVKHFVCHQANVNIIRAISKQLRLAPDQFIVNLDRYGNTASASVPIALDELLSGGAVGRGDLVVTAAFGGGLSWGANLLRL